MDKSIFLFSVVGISFVLSVYLVPSTSGDVVSLGILKCDGCLDMPRSVDDRL